MEKTYKTEYGDVIVTENNGKIKCNIVGVVFKKSKGSDDGFWYASYRNVGMDAIFQTVYPVRQLGFDKALLMAVDKRKNLEAMYSMNFFTAAEVRKINKIARELLPRAKDFPRKKKRKKNKRTFYPREKADITREYINGQVEEYLKNGGTIKKLPFNGDKHSEIFKTIEDEMDSLIYK